MKLNINDPRAYGPRVLEDELGNGVPGTESAVPSSAAGFAGGNYLDQSKIDTTVNVGAQLPGVYTKKSYRTVWLDLAQSHSTEVAFNPDTGDPIVWDEPEIEIVYAGTMFQCVWGCKTTGPLYQGPVPGSLFPPAADATPYAQVSFDGGDWITFGPGYTLSGIPYAKLRLRNISYPGQSLQLFLSADTPVDRLDAAN